MIEFKGMSYLGFLLGTFIIFISTWKLFPQNPSYSLFGCGVGFLIFIMSYIYSWMKCKDERDEDSEIANGKRYDLLWKKIEEVENKLK